MGKGRRRVSTSQTTVAVATRTPKKDSKEGIEAGGAGQNEQQSEPCWEFALENPDKAAIRGVSVGTSVQGQPVGSTILVTSSIGALGRAPQGVGRRIIKAQQESGGTLSGTVVEHQKTTVKVQLCLG